jgi:hypothetical protein
MHFFVDVVVQFKVKAASNAKHAVRIRRILKTILQTMLAVGIKIPFYCTDVI